MGAVVRGIHLIKAQFLAARRYRVDFYGSFLSPLLTIIPLVLLYYLGERSDLVRFFYNATNTRNIFGYLVLGAAYWNYVEILWSAIFSLRYYMVTGQLEEVFLMPLSGAEYILSWSALGILKVTMESIPIIIFAVLSNVFSITPMGLLAFLVVFVLSMIASFGFAFLFFGLTLAFKDADELVSLVGNAAPLLGGMFFPITVLPMPLRCVSYAFPFTWGVDLTRAFLMRTKTVLPLQRELLVLFSLSLGYFLAGWICLVVLQRFARKKGMQGF